MQYLTAPLSISSAKDIFFKNVLYYVSKKEEVTYEVNLKKYSIYLIPPSMKIFPINYKSLIIKYILL